MLRQYDTPILFLTWNMIILSGEVYQGDYKLAVVCAKEINRKSS